MYVMVVISVDFSTVDNGTNQLSAMGYKWVIHIWTWMCTSIMVVVHDRVDKMGTTCDGIEIHDG